MLTLLYSELATQISAINVKGVSMRECILSTAFKHIPNLGHQGISRAQFLSTHMHDWELLVRVYFCTLLLMSAIWVLFVFSIKVLDTGQLSVVCVLMFLCIVECTKGNMVSV